MSKLTVVVAFGAGYVLGAKAGRGRYEQIKTQAAKVAESPRFQSATDSAKAKAGEVAASVAEVAKEKVVEVASTAKDAAVDVAKDAKDKVQRDGSSSPEHPAEYPGEPLR